jgi:hypothetical protein
MKYLFCLFTLMTILVLTFGKLQLKSFKKFKGGEKTAKLIIQTTNKEIFKDGIIFDGEVIVNTDNEGILIKMELKDYSEEKINPLKGPFFTLDYDDKYTIIINRILCVKNKHNNINCYLVWLEFNTCNLNFR